MRLHTNEQLYRDILDNISDAVYLLEVTEDGRFRNLEVNCALEDMSGLSREQLIGKYQDETVSPESAATVNAKFRRCVEAGATIEEEVELDLATGKRIYQSKLIPVRDESGRVHRILGITHDITDTRRDIQEMERWRDIFEHAQWGVVIGSTDGRSMALMNPEFARMHGYTVEELTGRPITDVYAPESRESLPAEIELAHQKGHHSFESVHLRKDGTTFPVLIDVTAVRDSQGNVLRRIVNIQEITERKCMDDKLRKSEERYRSLYTKTPVMLHSIDENGVLLSVSDYWLSVMGYQYEEVIGRNSTEFLTETSRCYAVEEVLPAFMKEGFCKDIQYQFVKKNGSIMDGLLSAIAERDAQGRVIRSLAVIVDITERKLIEEKLGASEREYRTLVENIPDFIVRFDAKCRHLYVNPAIERAFGIPAEHFIGKTESELEGRQGYQQQSQQSAELAEGVRRAFKDGQINHTEATWVLLDGERVFDVMHVPEKDENGKVVSVLGIAHDVTERKKMQEELHSREQKFRALAENSPNPIYRYDRECHRLYVNPVVGKILGKPVDELIGSTPADGAILVSEQNRKLMRAIHQVFDSGETIHIDLDFIGRDGRHREFDMLLAPECNVDGEVNTVLALAHDITAIRKVERRLTRFMVNVPGFVYTFRQSPEGDLSFPFVSPGIQDMYGLKPEDVRDDIMPLHALTYADDQPRILNTIAESARSMTPFHVEFRMQRPGQSQRWIEARSVPERDTDGGILWHGVMLDITERKVTEASLRESEERYRTLIQKIQAAVVVHGADTQIITTNTAAQEILGLTEEQLFGKKAIDPAWHFSREDGTPMSLDEYPVNIVLVSQKPLRNYVVRVHRPNRKNDVWVLVNADPVIDKDGDITQVIVTFIDITERKQAEEQLFMMDFALNHVREAVYLIRAPKYITYVNEEACRVLDYSREELLGKTLFDIDPDSDLEEFKEIDNITHRQGYHIFERRHQTKGGRIFPVEILATPFKYEGQELSIALVRDITERKLQQAEEEIRLRIFERLAQGGKLTEILNLVVNYVEHLRPDFQVSIMLVDETGKHLMTVVAPNLPREFSAAIDGIEIAEGNGSCGTAVWRGETVIADDVRTHPFWIPYRHLAINEGLLSCWSEPIHSSTGDVLGTFGIYRREPGGPNDTELELIRHASYLAAIAIERRSMEAALRKSEQDFRALVEHSPDYISRYDEQCRRTYVNPALKAVIGLPEAEILGKSPMEMSPIPESQEFMELIREVWRSRQAAEWEFRFRKNQDQIHWGHMRVVPEFGLNGEVDSVLAIGRDISAIKEAEKRLEKSHRELRELAARREATREEERRRIARELHDELGQLLTAIRMEMSMLKLQYELDDTRFQDKMQRIVTLVDRTIQGVRDVVIMLRPAALERGIVAALEWLVDEFSSQSGIDCKLCVNDKKIDLDEDRAIAIFRIVQESLTNVARHAGADQVIVELEQTTLGYHFKVCDNGKGFDLNRPKSKSLGLVGVRERVLSLGGELKIDSVPDLGTTLEIDLPL